MERVTGEDELRRLAANRDAEKWTWFYALADVLRAIAPPAIGTTDTLGVTATTADNREEQRG